MKRLLLGLTLLTSTCLYAHNGDHEHKAAFDLCGVTFNDSEGDVACEFGVERGDYCIVETTRFLESKLVIDTLKLEEGTFGLEWNTIMLAKERAGVSFVKMCENKGKFVMIFDYEKGSFYRRNAKYAVIFPEFKN